MTRLRSYLSSPVSPTEPVTRGMVVGTAVFAFVMFALLLANFAWSQRVAEQRDVARMQRDVARAQVAKVRDGCAVRVSDGYAECKPGAIVYGPTTTAAAK